MRAFNNVEYVTYLDIDKSLLAVVLVADTGCVERYITITIAIKGYSKPNIDSFCTLLTGKLLVSCHLGFILS